MNSDASASSSCLAKEFFCGSFISYTRFSTASTRRYELSQRYALCLSVIPVHRPHHRRQPERSLNVIVWRKSRSRHSLTPSFISPTLSPSTQQTSSSNAMGTRSSHWTAARRRSRENAAGQLSESRRTPVSPHTHKREPTESQNVAMKSSSFLSRTSS